MDCMEFYTAMEKFNMADKLGVIDWHPIILSSYFDSSEDRVPADLIQ